MRPALVHLVVLFLGAAPSFAVEAESYEPPEYVKQLPELPVGVDPATALRMTAKEAIQTAVTNNLGIVLTMEQLEVARQGIPLSLGAFEPSVAASYQHSNAESPPTTVQEGMAGQIFNVIQDGWNVGLRQRLHSGTQLEVDLRNNRSRNTLVNALSPQLFRSSLELSVTQPLLRGFSLDLTVPQAEVLRAEFASESAWHEMQAVVVATVKSADDAYWDLVEALKTYQVARGSLRLAEEQLHLSQRQVIAGVLAHSDLITAETTLAQRQLAIVGSEKTIDDAADRLRQILNLPRDRWTAPILPVDAPRFEEIRVAEDDALTLALANRSEVQERRLDLERARLDRRVARNDELPQIDAGLSYGVVGQENTFSGALDALFDGRAPSWIALLNLTWTPLNRGARAKLAVAEAGERMARTKIEQLAARVRLEVRSAIRDLDSAARAVKAAAKFRALAEESLDAEQRKFINGTSSNFFVAQRQEELARARLSELTAVISHQKAINNLMAVRGDLLEKRGIDVRVLGQQP